MKPYGGEEDMSERRTEHLSIFFIRPAAHRNHDPGRIRFSNSGWAIKHKPPSPLFTALSFQYELMIQIRCPQWTDRGGHLSPDKNAAAVSAGLVSTASAAEKKTRILCSRGFFFFFVKVSDSKALQIRG